MRAKAVAVAAVLLSGGLLSVALAAWLDRHAAYRSPLVYGTESWTPRRAALAALEEEKARRIREAAEREEFLENLTPEKMVLLGHEITHDKGLCLNCHSFGDGLGGSQGPDLSRVGERAGSRIEGLSDVEYLAQSLYEPDAFIVPGYAGGMIAVSGPPIGLSDEEVVYVIAYLQSLGGTVTLAPGTRVR